MRSRLRTRHYELLSPLPPAAVLDRLGARLQPVPRSPFWYPKAGLAHIGAVNGDRFRIYVRGLGRNAWRWVYVGSADTDGEGTRLSGELGPPPWLLVAVALWVAVVAGLTVVAVIELVQRVADGGAVTSALVVALGPVVMMALFVAVSNAGWRKAGEEWTSMEQWLEVTVQARPVTS